jgi:hypothetical protein
MIATVFPPVPQYVGGVIGAAICMIAARYCISRSRWVLLLAMGVGFIVGQLVVGHILILMGSYHPIVVSDCR